MLSLEIWESNKCNIAKCVPILYRIPERAWLIPCLGCWIKLMINSSLHQLFYWLNTHFENKSELPTYFERTLTEHYMKNWIRLRRTMSGPVPRRILYQNHFPETYNVHRWSQMGWQIDQDGSAWSLGSPRNCWEESQIAHSCPTRGWSGAGVGVSALMRGTIMFQDLEDSKNIIVQKYRDSTIHHR